MRLTWTTTAIRDLIASRAYIARDNPIAAADIARRIVDSVQPLSQHPALGRPGRSPGTRELIVAATPYIIPYRIVDQTVQLLRVLHAARRWPENV